MQLTNSHPPLGQVAPKLKLHDTIELQLALSLGEQAKSARLSRASAVGERFGIWLLGCRVQTYGVGVGMTDSGSGSIRFSETRSEVWAWSSMLSKRQIYRCNSSST